MKIAREMVSASRHAGAFIHVCHRQVETSGLDMGGDLWFEAQHAFWLADTLRASIDNWMCPVGELRSGADQLRVFESGHEWQPVINLRNRRDPAVTHGGVYVLMMSPPIAAQLARSLDALAQA